MHKILFLCTLSGLLFTSACAKASKPIDIELAVQKELRQLSGNWGDVHAKPDFKGPQADVRAHYTINGEQYMLTCHTNICQHVYVCKPSSKTALHDSEEPFAEEVGVYHYDWDKRELLNIQESAKRRPSVKEKPLFDASVLDQLFPAAVQLRAVVAKASGTPGRSDD